MPDKRLLAPGPKGREDVSGWTWAGVVAGAACNFEVLENPTDRRFCAVVRTAVGDDGEPAPSKGQKVVATTEKGVADAFKWACMLMEDGLKGK